MADFIIPILLIIGGMCWTIIRVYAEMMCPIPSKHPFGFAGPAAAIVGTAWLATTIAGLF